MMMQPRHTFGTLFSASLLSIALIAPASAQWIWKDDAGHVVASDQPPPASVPQSRIIKAPRARAGAPLPTPDKDAGKTDVAKGDAPKSAADKDLDAKQKQKEAADAAKTAEDEAARNKAMAENCTSVRSNLAALQAGGRAARFNEKGERVYLDDSQRASEIQKSQGQITQYCK